MSYRITIAFFLTMLFVYNLEGQTKTSITVGSTKSNMSSQSSTSYFDAIEPWLYVPYQDRSCKEQKVDSPKHIYYAWRNDSSRTSYSSQAPLRMKDIVACLKTADSSLLLNGRYSLSTRLGFIFQEHKFIRFSWGKISHQLPLYFTGKNLESVDWEEPTNRLLSIILGDNLDEDFANHFRNDIDYRMSMMDILSEGEFVNGLKAGKWVYQMDPPKSQIKFRPSIFHKMEVFYTNGLIDSIRSKDLKIQLVDNRLNGSCFVKRTWLNMDQNDLAFIDSLETTKSFSCGRYLKKQNADRSVLHQESGETDSYTKGKVVNGLLDGEVIDYNGELGVVLIANFSKGLLNGNFMLANYHPWLKGVEAPVKGKIIFYKTEFVNGNGLYVDPNFSSGGYLCSNTHNDLMKRLKWRGNSSGRGLTKELLIKEFPLGEINVDPKTKKIEAAKWGYRIYTIEGFPSRGQGINETETKCYEYNESGFLLDYKKE